VGSLGAAVPGAEETGNLEVTEMADWKFNRGLDDEFVDHLNALYDNGESWWKDLMDDGSVFLAIRDNYLNFYYRGCSLLELAWQRKNRMAVGKIHYKYLLKPSMKPEYISVINGKLKFRIETDNLFPNRICVVDLKKSVKRYAEEEKSGVHDIIMDKKNYNVVDVEIALSDGSSAKRIDIATLRQTEDGPVLKFFEAKHFKNKELRAQKDAVPAVVNQLTEYEELLDTHKEDINDSYSRVWSILSKLHGFKERNENRFSQLESVKRNWKPLSVDTKPKLVVFGFDEDQRDGNVWKMHRRKLKKELGKDRLIFRGQAKYIDLKSV